MATRYEYYNTGDTTGGMVNPTAWRAQTFTPRADHTITSVKLKMYRFPDAETLYVEIRATDANGKPTGGVLSSGSIDASTFTTNSAGAWYEISLSAYTLLAGTKYAIVLHTSAGTIGWRLGSNGYPRGTLVLSSDSGETWTVFGAYDQMFEEWGEPAISLPTVTTNAISDIGFD